MIIYQEKQTIVLTPGKCASTTVRKTLEKELGQEVSFCIGPQGQYWRQYGIDSYKDSVGKHSVCIPYMAQTYKRYILYRPPFDRMVSFWKHYCKYSSHEVDFSTFVGLVEQWKKNNDKNMWFYTWRMDDIVREAGYCGIIHYNNLNQLNELLGTNINFPVLHSTTHEAWQSYYTPELYRRVLDIA